jgi:hypothetical protein
VDADTRARDRLKPMSEREVTRKTVRAAAAKSAEATPNLMFLAEASES